MALSMGLGYAFSTYIHTAEEGSARMGRVTGIGGIFFKCRDPKKMRLWYQTHLGLNMNPYGSVFEWRQAQDSTKKGYTQWSLFRDSSTYFAPSTRDFMINYRVDHLEALVGALQKSGVTIVDKMEVYDYGKFIHILDMEGNKLELWEPNDVQYEKLGVEMGLKTTK